MVEAQVFPMIGGRYSLDHHARVSFESEQWQRVRFELPFDVWGGPLRLDLAQQPCILDIAGLGLRSTVQDNLFWSVAGAEIAKLQPAGDMSLLRQAEQKEFTRFISTGNDPQLLLTKLERPVVDVPLQLECRVRAIIEAASMLRELTVDYSHRVRSPVATDDEIKAAFQKLEQDHAALLEKLEATDTQMELLHRSYRKLQGDLYVTKTDLQITREEIQRARAALDEAVHARNLQAQKCNALESEMEKIVRSKSWRITAPLRRLLGSG